LTDLFEEVEEQLRSDRYRTLAIRALPWLLGVGAAVLIGAIAYWGWQAYQSQAATKASETYAQAVDALNQGHKDQAVKLWTQVSKSPARGYKSLALMQLAGLQLEADKPKDAVKLFDRAADAAPDEVIGDAARLKSAFTLLDTAPKEAEARLTPLIKDGRPYRTQAQEGVAFAKLMAGDVKGARKVFAAVSQALDAPEGARQRARAAVNLIDSGSAAAVPAIAKAEAALPPVQLEPGQTTPGQAPAQPQPSAPGPQ
jgi:hypothetical protein